MSFETSFPFYVERFKQIAERVTDDPIRSGLYTTRVEPCGQAWKGNVPFDESVEPVLIECVVRFTAESSTTTVYHPQIGMLVVTCVRENSSWSWYPAASAPKPLPGYFATSFQDLPGDFHLVRRLIDDYGTCFQLTTSLDSAKIVLMPCEGPVFEANALIRGTESMLPVLYSSLRDYPLVIELIEPLFEYSQLVSGISRNYEDTVRMNRELLQRQLQD